MYVIFSNNVKGNKKNKKEKKRMTWPRSVTLIGETWHSKVMYTDTK
jgi:hypothetical protein